MMLFDQFTAAQQEQLIAILEERLVSILPERVPEFVSEMKAVAPDFLDLPAKVIVRAYKAWLWRREDQDRVDAIAAELLADIDL